jgi:hypothetical protein
MGGALADDRLWVKTDATVCTIYLGVEANAALSVPNDDCGGRTLTYDTIDQSLSVLASGNLMEAVTDGVEANDVPTSDTFPYLAAPQGL